MKKAIITLAILTALMITGCRAVPVASSVSIMPNGQIIVNSAPIVSEN